jgi:AcrR family transcriptional regulator
MSKTSPTSFTRRLAPEEREQQIVSKAVEHFATHGFAGSTRELARQIGVTQPLLYRYFPSKDALIERVYQEIYRWDPDWEKQIGDRTLPLDQRLARFYKSYAKTILRREWIRTFIFAGLDREGINDRYLGRLKEKVFLPVLKEIRDDLGLSGTVTPAQEEAEIELVWSLHASIFYLGVRKWIYNLPITDDIEGHIDRQIDAFLNGSQKVMSHLQNKTDVSTD